MQTIVVPVVHKATHATAWCRQCDWHAWNGIVPAGIEAHHHAQTTGHVVAVAR